MRKFKFLSVLMALISVTFLVLADISPGAMAATDPDIQAKSALLVKRGPAGYFMRKMNTTAWNRPASRKS
jgi:hypothetical protein